MMGSLFDIGKLKKQALSAPLIEHRSALEGIEKLYKAKLKAKEVELAQVKRDFSSLKTKVKKSKNINVLKILIRFESLKKQHNDLLKSSRLKKDRLHQTSLEKNFLVDRIIYKYGAQAYLDIINSVDNPRGIPVKDLINFKKKHGLKF